MSQRKASQCEECAHHVPSPRFNPKPTCAKNHKPMFFMPPREDAGISVAWGWRRVCDDFQAKAAK